MLENSGFAAIIFNIELATGRVRPQADKGLLDPPDDIARFLRFVLRWARRSTLTLSTIFLKFGKIWTATRAAAFFTLANL